jgi:NAD(P)-dependent dehydrogenase (short-subunit alcohol dehydrogenase family)
MGQVQDKVAIVTGGASGIGAACSTALAHEGASVVVTDIDDCRGLAFVENMQASPGKVLYLHHDVTDEQGWPGVIETAHDCFGGLDILVANAGIAFAGPTVELAFAEWRRLMAVNVDGVFLSVKHAVPAMRRRGGGSIVIMSSVAGLRGSAGLSAYCASKGAVRLFAKAVALELAAGGDNIRVNTVHPGIIDTPIWGAISMNRVESFATAVPNGRVGQPSDIADGVLFLACDASSYMTGSELVIDGGMTAGSIRSRT